MAVKVTVANENEPGVVTLSRTQIRVGVPVTAELSDPDGSISGLTWQWYDAAVGDQSAIEDANSDTYTPVAEDVDDILTAVASYTDGHGPEKSAVARAAGQCGGGGHPEQGAGVRRPGRRDRRCAERIDNKKGGGEYQGACRTMTTTPPATDATDDNVGSVVTATDPDPNTEDLIYTLGGADADKFRVRSNGQIEVGAGTKLDYETKDTYMVTVMAEDSFGEPAPPSW